MILAFFIKRLDGSNVVEYSKYCYDNDGQEEENITATQEGFDNMLDSVGWESGGHIWLSVSKYEKIETKEKRSFDLDVD